MQNGALREDLCYRVNVLAIPLLAEAFLAEFNEKYAREVRGMDEAALALLNEHLWPGNVRELRNVIERAAVSCRPGLITADCLPLAPHAPAAVGRANVVVLPVGHHTR